MRKIVILMLFLLFPFVVKAESNIYIENIELYKNNNVVELSSPSAEDLNLNLNLQFKYYDSSITYKIIINNKTDEEYELDKSINYKNGDNIKYELTCDDQNKVILSNKKKVCYVKATYVEPVSFNKLKLENNSVKSEDEITLDLYGKQITNPNTGAYSYVLLSIMLILLGFLLYKYTSKKSALGLFIIVSILVPMVIKATTKISLKINSNVEIVGNTRKCEHEPKDFRGFTMCELTSIVYPYLLDNFIDPLYEEIMDSIDNNYDELTEQEIELINEMFSDVKKYIYNIQDRFNWDFSIKDNPTINNYSNYLDGIYINGIRMPIYSQSTMEDFDEFLQEIYTSGFANYKHEFKDSSVKDFQTFGFMKPWEKIDNIEYRIRNVSQDKISVEKASPSTANVVIGGYGDFTISRNILGEVEDSDLNFPLYSVITKTSDSVTGNDTYSFSKFNTHPEMFSMTFFHSRFEPINDLIDAYTYSIRVKATSKTVYNNFDNYYQIGKHLMSYLNVMHELGYIKSSTEDIISGNIDSKVREYQEWFDINLKDYASFASRYEACSNNTNCKNEVQDSFYETFHGDKNYNLENDIVVLSNGIIYEGREGFFEYLAKTLGLSNYSSAENAAAKKLFELSDQF